MIIKNTDTLLEYLTVNNSVSIETLAPYIKKAERNFLKPLIGAAQFAIFDATAPITDPITLSGQQLAQEAVANFAYYLGLPVLAVQINDSGIHVVDSEHTKTASDKQFKELQRSFKKSGHEALDELLELMEEKPTKLDPWIQSDNYTVYKGLLVNKTSIFNSYYHIFNSRQTFVAMRPNIKVCEDQFIEPVIGSELLIALKTKQTNAHRIEVKKILQQSIVAFTIMKTVDNGMFVLDAQGIHMKFDVLPYEKNVTNVNLKINDFLTRTKENKRIEGEEYLKIALGVITANATDFSEYTVKKTPDHVHLTDTKSIVGVL